MAAAGPPKFLYSSGEVLPLLLTTSLKLSALGVIWVSERVKVDRVSHTLSRASAIPITRLNITSPTLL